MNSFRAALAKRRAFGGELRGARRRWRMSVGVGLGLLVGCQGVVEPPADDVSEPPAPLAMSGAEGPVLRPLNPGESPPPGYVRIPGGYAHPSCVHEVPYGSTFDSGTLGVRDEAGQLVARYAPCRYPTFRHAARDDGPSADAGGDVPGTPTSGYMSAVEQNMPSGAQTWSSFTSQVVVPQPMVDAGQTMFFWPGVAPSNGQEVLQPVLQWGVSRAGGGPFWAIAAWDVTANATLFSAVRQVNPGDVIRFSGLLNNGVWQTCALDSTIRTQTCLASRPTMIMTKAWVAFEYYFNPSSFDPFADLCKPELTNSTILAGNSDPTFGGGMLFANTRLFASSSLSMALQTQQEVAFNPGVVTGPPVIGTPVDSCGVSHGALPNDIFFGGQTVIY